MEDDEIQRRRHKTFADIRHVNDSGAEFWYARDLQYELEYTEWRNFEKVINKAVTACRKSGCDPNDHFVCITKMVMSNQAKNKAENSGLKVFMRMAEIGSFG